MRFPGTVGAQAWAVVGLLTAVAVGQACRGDKEADRRAELRKGRKEPICAVQDCATGEVIDDGCDATGRCASCINSCVSGTPPSVGGHAP